MSVAPARTDRGSTPALCSPRFPRAQIPGSHREMDPHAPPLTGAVDIGWAKLLGIGKAEFAEHWALRAEVNVQEVRCGS